VSRAEGPVPEVRAEELGLEGLATEWEWEDSPEMTLALVDDLDEAIDLCNAHSPRFIVSVSARTRPITIMPGARSRPVRRGRFHPLGRRAVRAAHP
jgi:hypothetical protein